MKSPRNSTVSKIVKWLWVGLGILIIFTILFFFGVSRGMLGPLPSVEELENPRNLLASEVISEDGVVLGKYFAENRTNVQFEEISPWMAKALVATEDERFFRHSGFDLKSFGRAIFGLGKQGGASTITQQLAKMLFTDRAENFFMRVIQKFKEWVIAVELEKRYTKEEIIAMYLNRFDFLNLAVGVKSAAKIYFSTTPDSLQLNQAALLIGMAKNPSLYNPLRDEELATQRRNVVFAQMRRNGILSQEQTDSLYALPLGLKVSRESHDEGPAAYFREILRMRLSAWAKERGYDLYRDGLKIYTTLNSRLQQYAEEAVAARMGALQLEFNEHWKGRVPWQSAPQIIDSAVVRCERYKAGLKAGLSKKEIMAQFSEKVKMRVLAYDKKGNLSEVDTLMTPLDSIKYYKTFLHTGFMSMDPHTGAIKAWVGGINHRHFKYDHVNIRATRQVGSTFKPFVYTLAVDNGYSPCFMAPNEPVVFEEFNNWSPKNSDGKSGGEMELFRALANSVNLVTAYLMKQLGPKGPDNVISLARKMGVKNNLDPYPSICLGTMDLSVYEMVGAFGTYANRGVHIEPFYLQRIEDRHGQVLETFTAEENEAMSEQTAWVMLKMMERVTVAGTGVRLRYKYGISYEVPIAGKTGTTQNNSDGWFIGTTPDLVSGVWVGADDRAVHFRSTNLGQGAHMALPIWAMYMEKVLADTSFISTKSFFTPSQPVNIETDCSKYRQPMKGGNDPFN